MSGTVTKLVLAASLAIGGLTVSAPVVSAQDFGIRIGPDGVQVRDRDAERREREERRRGGCSEREARAAAREEGLRDPEVIRATSRSITVEGVTRRGRVDTIRFANEQGCPEI